MATDTIWGLGCAADDRSAVATIFSLKKRDFSKPLVLFVASLEQAASIQHIPKALLEWLQRHWPGSLTFVSKATSSRYAHCHPQTDYIGIRIPAHTVPMDLIKLYQGPLAVSSFNVSGELPASPQHWDHDLMTNIEAVYGDCGTISHAVSAVIKYDGEKLLVLRAEQQQLHSLRSGLPPDFFLA